MPEKASDVRLLLHVIVCALIAFCMTIAKAISTQGTDGSFDCGNFEASKQINSYMSFWLACRKTDALSLACCFA